MRSVSLAAAQAILKEQVNQVFLQILKVEHPDLVSPLLLVADKQDLVRADGTYIAFGFSVELPEDDEESIDVVSLVIPIVDQTFVQVLRAAEGTFTATLSVVTAATPNTVEVGPFVFEAVGISFGSTHATISLAFNRNIFEDAYPKDLFSPSNRLEG